MAKRIANKNSSEYATHCIPFQGSNLRGEWNSDGSVYSVWSYWTPIFCYIQKNGQWFRNPERYSVTTSKQTSQVYPRHDGTMQTMTENDMRHLITYGFEWFAKMKLAA